MINKYTPLKVELFDNRKTRYTAAQVKAKTGADIVFNGGLFDMSTYQPNCDIKINGSVINDDQWTYWGYGWKNGELPHVAHTNDMPSLDNYLSCLWAIHNGEKQGVNDNSAGIGGVRGRTAFGFTADGEMVILCVSDANGAMKLSQARDKLFDAGCVNGIILDGGGSSQIITPTETVYSSRIVSNLVCVWIGKAKKEDETLKVCLDPGHGNKELNQSPDGSYFEHEFALDMANRIREHLVRCGVDVKLTREDSSTPGLTERATIANTWGADLYVSLHSNAVSGGWNDNTHGLTVWTYAKGGERDRAANLLLEQMAAYGVETFGSKLYHSHFTVLAKTSMPAYLVEYAFHTCHSDVELLKSNAYRSKLAEATARAICAWGGVSWTDEPEPQMPTGTIYRVQMGAFSVKENAESLMNELKAKGYSAYITEG